MALRDQPYLPLYVRDFSADEKLRNCSAESVGIYIMVMCFLHVTPKYGAVTLTERQKKSEDNIKNFACVLLRQLPFEIEEIERGLRELVEEGVLSVDGDTLYQKRMVKDGEISEKRAVAGASGGSHSKNSKAKCKANQKQNSSKSKAKVKQNTEIENEYEYESEIEVIKKDDSDFTNPFFGELHDAFDDWLAYKSEKRQPYKERGLKSLITQISRYAEQFGESETANAIRNSMASNYSGIVFDRIGKNGATPKPQPQKKRTFLDMYMEDDA